MRIAVWCSHIGADGIRPSGQHGGGELYTMAVLQLLSQYYEVEAVIPNGLYPAFESAPDYGLDLSGIDWRPVGNSVDWIRQYDVLISINHSFLPPAVCRRNILMTFFPQFPEWDVSGYDTIVGISEYTKKWIKSYWGREADVLYPAINLACIREKTADAPKQRVVLCIGRFFQVPGGNNKNHKVVLEAFQGMMLPDWQLHFVGAVQNKEYYDSIRKLALGDRRIFFHRDASRQELLDLLGKSTFLWAATGYGAERPSSREHFGIIAVEAMAAGAIPLVHNSGGTPETGALAWDEPTDLIATTKALIADEELRLATVEKLRFKAEDFSLEEMAPQLLEIIERPVVLPYNPNQTKIFIGKMKPEEIKVGMLSDSPNITTGFATLTRMIGIGLQERGFKVTCWGMQDPHQGSPHHDDPFPVWRGCIHDASGWTHLAEFVRQEKPDVLYLNYDPGNVRAMIEQLRKTDCSAPIIAYLPIEGAPIVPQIVETLRLIYVFNGEPLLYTRWAVEAVKAAGGPACRYVWHGADHAPFRRLPDGERKKLRFAVGWKGRFVCGFTGRNKRTKGFGALLQTARLLKDQGHDDIVWYLHTDPNDVIANSSMPLTEMVRDMGLEETVIFPHHRFQQTHGIPYDTPPSIQVPDTDDLTAIRRANLNALTMIERYNVLDVFVNLSEAEGFGLPSLEAMGCGVPVVSVDDQGVQREVLGNAPLYVPVSHWDTWHTGARLAQADPRNVATAILKVKEDAELRAEMGQASLERWATFKWQDTVDAIAKTILERVL